MSNLQTQMDSLEGALASRVAASLSEHTQSESILAVLTSSTTMSVSNVLLQRVHLQRPLQTLKSRRLGNCTVGSEVFSGTLLVLSVVYWMSLTALFFRRATLWAVE